MAEKIDVAKVLIQNKDGEFLVVQKSNDYDWKAGKWELPGGKIESEENKFKAAKRETKSETGLESEEFQETVRTEVEEPNSDKPVVNCWILYTDKYSGSIELSDEHQDFKWVSAEEFLTINWHRDAGYAIPAIKYLDSYQQ